jgi:hypothetical protein
MMGESEYRVARPPVRLKVKPVVKLQAGLAIQATISATSSMRRKAVTHHDFELSWAVLLFKDSSNVPKQRRFLAPRRCTLCKVHTAHPRVAVG